MDPHLIARPALAKPASNLKLGHGAFVPLLPQVDWVAGDDDRELMRLQSAGAVIALVGAARGRPGAPRDGGRHERSMSLNV